MAPSVRLRKEYLARPSSQLTSRQDRQSLKDLAQEKSKTNPTQLGDPISLKAETSDNEPTENDRPNKSIQGRAVNQAPGEKKKDKPTQLGDPVSLKSETSNSEPTEHDGGALGTIKNGKPKM